MPYAKSLLRQAFCSCVCHRTVKLFLQYDHIVCDEHHFSIIALDCGSISRLPSLFFIAKFLWHLQKGVPYLVWLILKQPFFGPLMIVAWHLLFLGETRRSCVSQQKVCTQKSFLMDNSNLCKIHTMVVDHLLFYCYEHDAYLFLVMRLDTFNTGAFKLNTLV
jgi:hypothetical protein